MKYKVVNNSKLTNVKIGTVVDTKDAMKMPDGGIWNDSYALFTIGESVHWIHYNELEQYVDDGLSNNLIQALRAAKVEYGAIATMQEAVLKYMLHEHGALVIEDVEWVCPMHGTSYVHIKTKYLFEEDPDLPFVIEIGQNPDAEGNAINTAANINVDGSTYGVYAKECSGLEFIRHLLEEVKRLHAKHVEEYNKKGEVL